MSSADAPQRKEWSEKEKDATIKVALDRKDGGGSIVVCEQVPANHLFATAPALLRFVHSDKVILSGELIDDKILEEVIKSIVLCGQQGKPFGIHFENHTTTQIKLHIILISLGMKREADNLLQHLWNVFQTYEMKTEDVLWLWETFGAEVKEHDASRFLYADTYVQMMAWQIVTAKSLGKLNSPMHKLVFGEGFSGHALLRGVVEQREKEYGTTQGYGVGNAGGDYGFQQPGFDPSRETVVSREGTVIQGVEASSVSKGQLSAGQERGPTMREKRKHREDKNLQEEAARKRGRTEENKRAASILKQKARQTPTTTAMRSPEHLPPRRNPTPSIEEELSRNPIPSFGGPILLEPPASNDPPSPPWANFFQLPIRTSGAVLGQGQQSTTPNSAPASQSNKTPDPTQ